MARFIDHIDVHHSASDNDSVEGIRNYHAVTLGWGEIAYNELIDHDGNLCFGKSDAQYPFSTGSFVRDGSGWAICILGLFDGDTLPSPAQWATLIKRLKEKSAEFGTKDIKGHRERYANSECPGFSDAVLNQMRDEVFSEVKPDTDEGEEPVLDSFHDSGPHSWLMLEIGKINSDYHVHVSVRDDKADEVTFPVKVWTSIKRDGRWENEGDTMSLERDEVDWNPIPANYAGPVKVTVAADQPANILIVGGRYDT